MGSDSQNKTSIRNGYLMTGLKCRTFFCILFCMGMISFIFGVRYAHYIEQQQLEVQTKLVEKLTAAKVEMRKNVKRNKDFDKNQEQPQKPQKNRALDLPSWMLKEWRDGKDLLGTGGANDTTSQQEGVSFNESTSSKLRIQKRKKKKKKKCDLSGASNSTTTKKKNILIISNMLGQTEQNLMEVSFAKLLATQLESEACMEVIVLYRNLWNSGFLTKQSDKCFPNALWDDATTLDQQKIKVESILLDSGINESLTNELWDAMTSRQVNGDILGQQNELYENWITKWSNMIHTIQVQPFRKVQTQDMEEIPFSKNLEIWKKDSTKIFYLRHFFHEYGWIKHYHDEVKEYMSINYHDNVCCPTTKSVPNNAIVLFIRDYWDDDEENELGVEAGAYQDILNHYHYNNNPLWIVCQNESVFKRSRVLQDLVRNYDNRDDDDRRVTVYTGKNRIGSICIMSQAKILISAPSSPMSQIPGIMRGKDQDQPSEKIVHAMIHKLDYPRSTLNVPGWKYHIISKDKDGIDIFDAQRLKTMPE